MKAKIKIISITYSMVLNANTIDRCHKADKQDWSRNLMYQIEQFKEVKKVRYTNKPNKVWETIEITFWTDSTKEYHPKYNNTIWQSIAKIINNHIGEKL